MSQWLELGGAGIRRAIVVVAFLGIPMMVWYTAWPLVQELPLSTGLRSLLAWSIVATGAFGLASGFLVWRDLDREP